MNNAALKQIKSENANNNLVNKLLKVISLSRMFDSFILLSLKPRTFLNMIIRLTIGSRISNQSIPGSQQRSSMSGKIVVGDALLRLNGD
ncbi:hypothetical protein [Duffyella gerundensis]|uniref:hypothetical protein n=1 Tax=Duffyella TaxID=3026546 RepID=UPI0016549B5B|nr:hypothetical protein [Duffyella gerundensis]QTO56103.1 hypothetical protein J8I88_05560 [Duffyella gerundensis]